jgi:hypothetical protein
VALSQQRTEQEHQELQLKYNNKIKEVKQSVRKNKRNWINEMAGQAENAAAIGNIKELNRITKVLANKKFNRRKQIKDINCQLLTTEREQIKRWHEYFSEVLNPQIETEPEASRYEESEEDIIGERLKININLPSKKEIMQCKKEMKIGKAPGPEYINV